MDNIQMGLGQVVYDDMDCVELVRQVRSGGKALCWQCWIIHLQN